MTSRPGPSIAPRTATGALQRQPTQGRSVAHQHAYTRQPDNVIDLTADESKPSLPDAAQKGSNAKQPADGRWATQESQFAAPDGFNRLNARGKPQIFFEDDASLDGVVAGLARPASAGQRISPTINVGSLPIPPRPGFRVQKRPSQQGLKAASSVSLAGSKRDSTLRSGPLDTPAEAMRLSRGKTVDFYPWNGSHPEDALSAEVVKVGYFDDRKGQIDINAGKTYVGPQLRNKATLSTLSSIFVQALEKRSASGRVKEPSSFKPPPRITVTDTKREEWLRNLANPALPPGILTRRIPHGIKGKLLLEQCLGKNIPIARAVWLAKCVGANEMRAWMRKGASSTSGMGGELKWVREWTVFVEQFVDSTISNCGQPGWKSKMDYTIRLSSHLYTERLLDQDHYLDWLMTSLEGSELDRLPVWLLLVQIYWQDLVAIRRRGRRLAEALLMHFDTMTAGDNAEVDHPMAQRTRLLLTTLVMSHRNCMVIPRSWKKCRHVLKKLLVDGSTPALQAAFRSIARRNDRLVEWGHKSGNTYQSPQRQVLTMLDAVSLDVNIESLSKKCLAALPESGLLVTTVLQWACSLYREGRHRIYVTARLLRKWRTKGVDTDSAILTFLGDRQRLRVINGRGLFRLVGELVRSKHLSVGRYLQWLIASGSLSASGDITKTHECHLRLIAEIPLHGLPEHVLNLRHTLLQVALRNNPGALDILDDHVSITKQLAVLFEPDNGTTISFDVQFSELSTGVRLELSHWMRQELFSRLINSNDSTTNESDNGMKDDYALTLSRFYSMRDIIEQLEDFAILADILGISIESDDQLIFAAIADTLNYHHRTFAAIGALRHLFDRLVERYGKLRPEKPLERPFLLTLADLCCRLHADRQILDQLNLDIARLEQRSAVAACSPASDNMADFHSAKMDADEEIDRILTSGTSMDENMVQRVFARVLARIDEQIGNSVGQGSRFGQWFQRLKTFDEKAFERLMSECVSNLLISPKEELLGCTLPSAVGSGCLSLESFVTFSAETITALRKANPALAAAASLRILDAILPMDGLQGLGQVHEVYRYRLEQEKFCEDSAQVALRLVRQALDLCSTSKGNFMERLSAVLSSDRLLRVLRFHASRNAQDFCVAIGIGQPSDNSSTPTTFDESRATVLKGVLDSLIDSEDVLGLSKLDAEQQASALVNSADDFSVPFCQLELQLLFKIHTESDEEGELGVADAIIQSIKASVEADKSTWPDLLTGLDGEMTRKLREYAETHILSAVTALHKSRATSAEEQRTPAEAKVEDEKVLQRYLSVLDLTAWSLEDKSQGQIIAALAEKLKLLREVLSHSAQANQVQSSDGKEDPSYMSAAGALCPWIHALLHVLVVHKSFLVSAAGKISTNHQAALMCILRSFLLHPGLQPYAITTEYIFDVAAALSDDLPDEVRAQLLRLETQKSMHDPRIAFIFGLSPTPDAWLGLITPIQQRPATPSTPGGPNSQMTQAQAQAQRNAAAQHQHQGFWQAQRHHHQQQQQQIQQQQQQQHPQHQQHQQRPGLGLTVAGLGGAGVGGPENYNKPVPFHLRRWEILPDSSTNATVGNETSLSLTLFGAKKVV